MAKSSELQLKRRGKFNEEDLSNYLGNTKEEIIALLDSKEAFERSIGAKLISNFNKIDDSIIVILCEKLANEQKLYTKIEICNTLSKIGDNAAREMVNHLGKIGGNQYNILPEEDFQKKSYPLPRDIIARTLAHMNKSVLPFLVDILKTEDVAAIREAIDAIGFICFYDYTDYPIKDLIHCLEEQSCDEIIRWKIIRAFSSFKDDEVIEILESTKVNDTEERIRNEAERSLSIITYRFK